MDFVNNPASLKLLGAFCILSVVHSIITIASNRKTWRENNKI
jgi:hypothetical protein